MAVCGVHSMASVPTGFLCFLPWRRATVMSFPPASCSGSNLLWQWCPPLSSGFRKLQVETTHMCFCTDSGWKPLELIANWNEILKCLIGVFVLLLTCYRTGPQWQWPEVDILPPAAVRDHSGGKWPQWFLGKWGCSLCGLYMLEKVLTSVWVFQCFYTESNWVINRPIWRCNLYVAVVPI